MDSDRLLKDNCASNAAALQGLISELEAAVARLKSAKLAFESATTWTEHDAAYGECAMAVRDMPSRAEALDQLVRDPT
jgi:hypothetical protein